MCVCSSQQPLELIFHPWGGCGRQKVLASLQSSVEHLTCEKELWKLNEISSFSSGRQISTLHRGSTLPGFNHGASSVRCGLFPGFDQGTSSVKCWQDASLSFSPFIPFPDLPSSPFSSLYPISPLFLFVCIYMSVFVYGCAGACAHVCACMWSPEVNAECHSSGTIHLLETGSLTEHHAHQDWPASPRDPSLCLLSTGIASMCRRT